jgi:dolichol-phosphate mannosyltransferase
MTCTPQILVATATYNERESLPYLFEAIRASVPAVDILVVDDNSPDGTGQWVDEQAANDPRIRVIHRSGKLGLGTATIAAFQFAIEQDYEFLVALDADGSHDPARIPVMLERAQTDTPPPDVVIGSRYVSGGGTEGWPLYRRFMSRAVNLYARILLGLPCHDCSGSFRCMRVTLLREIDLAAVRSRGYSFFEEILWHFKRAGARFDEVPITFRDRKYGSSKINGREAITALWLIFRLGIRNWLGLSPSGTQ